MKLIVLGLRLLREAILERLTLGHFRGYIK